MSPATNLSRNAAVLFFSVVARFMVTGQPTTTWFPQDPVSCGFLVPSERTLLLTSTVTGLGGDQIHMFFVNISPNCAGNDTDTCWGQGQPVYGRSHKAGMVAWECWIMPKSGLRRRSSDFSLTMLPPRQPPTADDPGSTGLESVVCSVVCRAGGVMPDGNLTDTVFCSDDGGGLWSYGPSLPWASADASAWQVDGWVYLAGGMAGALGNGSAAVIRARIDTATCRILGSWEVMGNWSLGLRSFATVAVAPGSQKVVVSSGWSLVSNATGMGQQLQQVWDLWVAPVDTNMTVWEQRSLTLPYVSVNVTTKQRRNATVPLSYMRLAPTLAMSEVWINEDPYSFEKTDASGFPWSGGSGASLYGLLIKSGTYVMVAPGPDFADITWSRQQHVIYPGPYDQNIVAPESAFSLIVADLSAGRQPLVVHFNEMNRPKEIVKIYGYPQLKCNVLSCPISPVRQWTSGCARSPWDAPPCTLCTSCAAGEYWESTTCGTGSQLTDRFKDTVCAPCSSCSALGLVEATSCSVKHDARCESPPIGGGRQTPTSTARPDLNKTDPILPPGLSAVLPVSPSMWNALLAAVLLPAAVLVPLFMLCASTANVDSQSAYYCTASLRRKGDVTRVSCAQTDRGLTGVGLAVQSDTEIDASSPSDPASNLGRKGVPLSSSSALDELHLTWRVVMEQGRRAAVAKLRFHMFAGAWLSLAASTGCIGVGIVILQTLGSASRVAAACGTFLCLLHLAAICSSIVPLLLDRTSAHYWKHPLFHISIVRALSESHGLRPSTLRHCVHTTLWRCLAVEVPSCIALCIWFVSLGTSPAATPAFITPTALVLLMLLSSLAVDCSTCVFVHFGQSVMGAGRGVTASGSFPVQEWTNTPLAKDQSSRGRGAAAFRAVPSPVDARVLHNSAPLARQTMLSAEGKSPRAGRSCTEGLRNRPSDVGSAESVINRPTGVGIAEGGSSGVSVHSGEGGGEGMGGSTRSLSPQHGSDEQPTLDTASQADPMPASESSVNSSSRGTPSRRQSRGTEDAFVRRDGYTLQQQIDAMFVEVEARRASGQAAAFADVYAMIGLQAARAREIELSGGNTPSSSWHSSEVDEAEQCSTEHRRVFH